jgi:hypothetical protein
LFAADIISQKSWYAFFRGKPDMGLQIVAMVCHRLGLEIKPSLGQPSINESGGMPVGVDAVPAE